MLPALLLLAASAAAAADAGAGGARTFPIRNAKTGEHSADPAARLAWLHDQAYHARLKYADRLGLNVNAIKASRKRDVQCVDPQTSLNPQGQELGLVLLGAGGHRDAPADV
jgi:hypothetical protein